MKTSLGVIGGMGPKATSVFFNRVVERTKASSDQGHLDMIIVNHATLPDRTEAIQNNTGELFLKEINKDFRLLEQAGVSTIAIPCNTSHYFYDQMQSMTEIPIIHMVKETLQYTGRFFGRGSRVGILATTGTINSGIYREAALQYGLNLIEPGPAIQQRVMSLIYDGIKNSTPVNPAMLEEIITSFIKELHCNCVIIGCTELSVIEVKQNIRRYCVDAMNVLVEQSILLSGKQLLA
ncbi:aspartate/glutamate racemase family protein [Paenibacillus gansuensis]|uniref:Aspartate/glutamate racemase family protein n=1 Tax=Paenibacillus gansuensis TaxID=306542 RepID=A0ABW5PE80_9BACL